MCVTCVLPCIFRSHCSSGLIGLLRATMTDSQVAKFKEWAQTKSKDALIDLCCKMTQRTTKEKHANVKLQENLVELQKQVYDVHNEKLGLEALLHDAKQTISELTRQLENPYQQYKVLAELEKTASSMGEDKDNTQALIKQLKGTNIKERNQIAGVHISLIQGLIRTKFLADAAVKWSKLDAAKQTGAEVVEDMSEVLKAAPKWVCTQLNNQSRDFLERYSINSTEYDYERHMFVLRNHHPVMGPFISVWHFNFYVLYGDA